MRRVLEAARLLVVRVDGEQPPDVPGYRFDESTDCADFMGERVSRGNAQATPLLRLRGTACAVCSDVFIPGATCIGCASSDAIVSLNALAVLAALAAGRGLGCDQAARVCVVVIRHAVAHPGRHADPRAHPDLAQRHPAGDARLLPDAAQDHDLNPLRRWPLVANHALRSFKTRLVFASRRLSSCRRCCSRTR